MVLGLSDKTGTAIIPRPVTILGHGGKRRVVEIYIKQYVITAVTSLPAQRKVLRAELRTVNGIKHQYKKQAAHVL